MLLFGGRTKSPYLKVWGCLLSRKERVVLHSCVYTTFKVLHKMEMISQENESWHLWEYFLCKYFHTGWHMMGMIIIRIWNAFVFNTIKLTRLFQTLLTTFTINNLLMYTNKSPINLYQYRNIKILRWICNTTYIKHKWSTKMEIGNKKYHYEPVMDTLILGLNRVNQIIISLFST